MKAYSFYRELDTRFSDLLRTAFLHASYLNEHPLEKEDNQRLEFLGDASLDP